MAAAICLSDGTRSDAHAGSVLRALLRSSRCNVPTGRNDRRRPMRRDRKDQLGLADIGGEAGAATYGASKAGRECGRQPARGIGESNQCRWPLHIAKFQICFADGASRRNRSRHDSEPLPERCASEDKDSRDHPDCSKWVPISLLEKPLSPDDGAENWIKTAGAQCSQREQ
jgi:hypothetical protein